MVNGQWWSNTVIWWMVSDAAKESQQLRYTLKYLKSENLAWIKFGGLASTNVNTDIGGSYFKLVDDQTSTRARPRHIPTLSNCTHTLSRIIHWGKWLPRQVYTYNTCTSCNQSSNMESELALHSRVPRFQEHSDSTYRWAVILQKRNWQW